MDAATSVNTILDQAAPIMIFIVAAHLILAIGRIAFYTLTSNKPTMRATPLFPSPVGNAGFVETTKRLKQRHPDMDDALRYNLARYWEDPGQFNDSQAVDMKQQLWHLETIRLRAEAEYDQHWQPEYPAVNDPTEQGE